MSKSLEKMNKTEINREAKRLAEEIQAARLSEGVGKIQCIVEWANAHDAFSEGASEKLAAFSAAMYPETVNGFKQRRSELVRYVTVAPWWEEMRSAYNTLAAKSKVQIRQYNFLSKLATRVKRDGEFSLDAANEVFFAEVERAEKSASRQTTFSKSTVQRWVKTLMKQKGLKGKTAAIEALETLAANMK